jgi:hypothetical protein
VLRIDARVRPIRRTRASRVWRAPLVVALLASTAPVAELRLPPHASDLPEQIATACLECAASGYVACGAPEVGFGYRQAG